MSVDVSPFEVASFAGTAPLRAAGVARLRAERIAGQTVAMDMDEQGPLRLRFPRVRTGDALDVVIVNTGGGVVGGDKLEFEIEADEGASVAITSQAAEKVYRSSGADAEILVRLSAAPRAKLAWVPQETILFDRARVRRRIEADLVGNASLTICESIVFGRVAMGESIVDGLLKDCWRIRHDGKLVFADAMSLDGDIAKTLSGPAVANGAVTAGTIVHAAPNAEAKIDAVRAALEAEEAEAAASAFGGMLIVRILARDSIDLRSAILATLAALETVPPRAFTL